MASHWASTTDNHSFRFFTPEQIDQILREGAARGRVGSHAAIERILKHEPGLERAKLWQRIRQLKHPPRGVPFRRAVWSLDDDRLLRKGYEREWAGKQEAVRELLKRHPDWRPHVIWKRAAKLGLVQKRLRRGQEHSRQRWSDHDDRVLLNLTGYKDVTVIGKMLRRSPNAVRSRLRVLGKSSRAHKEGYARRALAEELHLGSRTIQRLIVEGLLEVRDPRITRESLDDLRKSSRLLSLPANKARGEAGLTPGSGGETDNRQSAKDSPPGPNDRPTMPVKLTRAKRVWAEVAAALNVSVEKIEKLIARGVLKLYDPRITEKSLRNFCRRNGSLINYDLLSRETRDWLQSSMDFVLNSGETVARRSEAYRKQARVTRRCGRCGRDIRGNVFFRHIKECGRAKPQPARTGSRVEQSKRNRGEGESSVPRGQSSR
jgi:hypothetical protein